MVSVNGVRISDEALQRELERHANVPEPRRSAIDALVMREVLLQAARSKLADAEAALQAIGAKPDYESERFVEEALIERLIEQEVVKPELAAGECETYYNNNLAQFRSNDLVEARHILFEAAGQVQPFQRQQAEAVLQQVRDEPEKFDELARAHSACTSAEVGGSLGQLSRGDTVPEFEQMLFALPAGQCALVETRFGVHVVRVERRAEGRTYPLEMVREQLGAHLLEQKRRHALRQYLRTLLEQADVQGVEGEPA
ncbi:MAG TPA: peptidylprolyl isomerase [Gallionellaceae bacterium]